MGSGLGGGGGTGRTLQTCGVGGQPRAQGGVTVHLPFPMGVRGSVDGRKTAQQQRRKKQGKEDRGICVLETR